MHRRVILSLVLCGTLVGKSPPHDWQKGEVAAIDVIRIPVTPKRMRYRYSYTIHGQSHTYVFDDNRKLDLTINGAVEYAVEGDKIFVRDEGGKERKETILQKAVGKPDQ